MDTNKVKYFNTFNKNAFDYQIEELKAIKSGELLLEQRKVPENKLINKGKPLTVEETNQIINEFSLLLRKGISQKNACDTISDKYGRGYWSILKMINTHKTTSHKPQTISLFD